MDLSCFLAGAVRMLTPPVLLYFWHKKTGARFYPALIAFAVCFPVFITGAMFRSLLSQADINAFALKRGLIYGILEEGSKYLMLRFHLTSYDSRRDAVTYGIGHDNIESLFAGLSCFGLIGTGRAAADIFWVNLFTAVGGVLMTVGLTVLIFYGIRTEKSKITLPAAILVHAVSNACMTIFFFSNAIIAGIDFILTAVICLIAYRCWKAMEDPFEDAQYFE